MSVDMWDLPDDKQTKKIVLKQLFANEKAGNNLEAGRCCLRLASLFRQIGPSMKSAMYGWKAVEYLRRADDKKALLKALRSACVPFEVGVDQAAYLREALALAQEIGDRREEARIIYQFTRAFTPSMEQTRSLGWLGKRGSKTKTSRSMTRYREMRNEYKAGHTVEEALAIFEEIKDPSGIAMCLVSLGIERKPSDRALFDRAISLYNEAGDTISATRTRMMADVSFAIGN